MSVLSPFSSVPAKVNIEDTYRLLSQQQVFFAPGTSAVCDCDTACIEYRRAVFNLSPVFSWRSPCQSCSEGKIRERALCALRPLPVYCKQPGCNESIDEADNVSGYCRACCRRAKTSKGLVVTNGRNGRSIKYAS